MSPLEVRTFNLSHKTEEILFKWSGYVPLTTMVWRHDGKQAKLFVGVVEENSGDKSIRIWDVETSKQFATSFHKYLRDFTSIHFNNDGTLAAVVKTDGTVSIWYMEGDKLGELKWNTASIQSVSFSFRGNMLAIIAKDGTTKLWQLGDLEELKKMGCNDSVRELRDYLKNNPNVSESDRQLCDDVPKVVVKDKSF